MGDYHKLDIWHRARALSIRVHRLVAALPAIDRFARGDQLIRSANSIRNNIVEGSGLGTQAQFARHLQYSIASADELSDQIHELSDVGLLSAPDTDLLSEPGQIAAMITVFRRRVLGSDDK